MGQGSSEAAPVVKKRVRQALERFARLVEASPYEPKQIILFGSHAKSIAHQHSDIDVCVVLDIADAARRRAAAFLIRLAGVNDLNMDVIVTTPQALKNDAVSPILHEIRRTGIVVFERGQASE